jgi:hypothetical protein
MAQTHTADQRVLGWRIEKGKQLVFVAVVMPLLVLEIHKRGPLLTGIVVLSKLDYYYCKRSGIIT